MGDCPIATTAIFSISSSNFEEAFNELFPVRKPIAEVYDQIIYDCLVAIEKAPDGSNKFKANKMGAKALLAKVYATMPNPDWNKTIQYCDEVIGGGYTLMPTFDHLLIVLTKVIMNLFGKLMEMVGEVQLVLGIHLCS